jgi:hypothetical protein
MEKKTITTEQFKEICIKTCNETNYIPVFGAITFVAMHKVLKDMGVIKDDNDV